MTELLERDRELAELQAMVSETSAGNGRLVVVEAAAGLGKTCLLQAARAAGRTAGMRVLSARATELERDFPFALVRQLFEPELAARDASAREALFDGAAGTARSALGLDQDGGATPPSADTFAVLHALYWLIAALVEQQPLLIAVDDAHWSDAASLDCLAFLLPRLEELPLLLVVACRPDEAGAESSLARIATDTLARRLTPRALSRRAAASLLAAELDDDPDDAFAATCHEVSGGNPFLLRELARTLAVQEIAPEAEQAPRVHELAPERVTRTVLVRLARLSVAARAVARALVVLGDGADHRLVAQLAGVDPDAALAGADELRAATILDPDATLRFIHPLVRTALHADLAAGERAAAHARAAALLRERGASPEQIAAQLLASAPRGERATAEMLLEAGNRALASGAPRSASAYLTRALCEPPPPDLRAAVLRALVTVSLRALDRSLFSRIEADVLAELEREPGLLLDCAAEVAPLMAIDGRVEAGAALLRRAIAIADGAGGVDQALHLEGQLIALADLPPADARTRLSPYRDRVQPGSAGERLLAAFDAAWSLFDGNAVDAAPLARRALHASALFAEQAELLVPGEALRVLVLTDDLDTARHVMDEALAIARGRGATWDLLGAWYLRAHVGLARGDLAAAEADLSQAGGLVELRGLVTSAPTFTALRVTILIERGELAAAQTTLDQDVDPGIVVPDIAFFDAVLFARGQLHLAQGRSRPAAEAFGELLKRRRRRGTSTSPLMQVGAYAARAHAALGEYERARELADAAVADARRWGAPSVVARALRAQAVTRAGPETIELLSEAAAVLEDSPARLERAHAQCELGAALRRANHRAAARDPLREALELARRCGAAGLAKCAFDELQASGEKVRRYTPIGVESLTASERRVAEMAASGMTNRQIAQTLFVTVKTIETHLAASYDKLGIRSRHQLAAALAAPAEAIPTATVR